MFGWEFPPMSSGGLGTACYGLTKALSKKSISIIFVLPYLDENLPLNYAKFVPANIKIRGIKSLLTPYLSSASYQTIRSNAPKRLIYGATLFEEVARYTQAAGRIALEEDFDVIHCHDWMTFGAGILAAEVSKKPLIVHVHATEFDRTGGNGVNQNVYNIEREGMHKATKIIAVSNYTKQKIVEHYGVSPDKIVVVHNGVDFEHVAAPEYFPIKEKRKIVLFLGRITLQKGPDYFLYAARKVLMYEPDTLFVMAGTGDMERWIIEKAAEFGIGDKILFTGFLNEQEANRMYKMADIFVMPSVSEPFGITPLEAIKNGTPCIISKQSGVSEVLSHCLKVDFWDVDQLSNNIIALLRYRPLHECMIEHAGQQVKYISWDNAADKYVSVYHGVTS